ncbi:MAG: phosphoglycerate kinase [Candidatus Cloacimonetes bacterium]|nr:phosphoglycerate kinase [Candidatus Cloacimonadota bacterium]
MLNLPKIQDAYLKGKIVLVRVDHNVVKGTGIKDPFRIDSTFGTLFKILSKGGKLILMTHVSRPKDKKTGQIKMDAKYSVEPIVKYLETKLQVKFHIPEIEVDPDIGGFSKIDESASNLVKKLRKGDIDGIYLPNVRWFHGEETKGEKSDEFAKQLAGLADVFVNDAFGSWQPHTSTTKVSSLLPSFAGLLMQHEIKNLGNIFQPKRPFISVIAGSKFDTKIGPLRELLVKSDCLLLGGVIYNAYLCIKYNIKIKGIDESELKTAQEFYDFAQQYCGKIIEPPFIIESDTLEGKMEGKYRTIDVRKLAPDTELNYVLDVAKESFDENNIRECFSEAESIFVNAVMGFTPHFCDGTKAMYELINENEKAYKMFGGGDTLQEFRALLSGIYLKAIDDPQYYFFTGGGTILKAIQEGDVTKLSPIAALLKM